MGFGARDRRRRQHGPGTCREGVRHAWADVRADVGLPVLRADGLGRRGRDGPAEVARRYRSQAVVDTVPTLRGGVAVEDLGVTLMHEHLFVLTADRVLDDPGSLPLEVVVPAAVERLQELYDLGVRTIAAPSVIGHGRDITLWRRVGE